MRKLITLATAGLFLLSVQGAQAQKEVEPPAVPPMLEGQRPLAQPETREPAPKKMDEEKAKPSTKAKAKAKDKAKAKTNGKKAKKPAKVKKENGQKKTASVNKKKSQKSKTSKKKRPPAGAPKEPAGPEEG